MCCESGVLTGENGVQQAEASIEDSICGTCAAASAASVSVSAALHVHPVNSQVTRSSALTCVSALVVETAAVVLACAHALKF